MLSVNIVSPQRWTLLETYRSQTVITLRSRMVTGSPSPETISATDSFMAAVKHKVEAALLRECYTSSHFCFSFGSLFSPYVSFWFILYLYSFTVLLSWTWSKYSAILFWIFGSLSEGEYCSKLISCFVFCKLNDTIFYPFTKRSCVLLIILYRKYVNLLYLW